MNKIKYDFVTLEGLEIFYREAGFSNKPTLLLLHGFPTSSHMFRNLINDLSDHYHVIAPDYPGYGNSSMPSNKEFEYSFDNLANIVEKFIIAKELKKFSLYVMDYGAPIGFRVASNNPERIESLLIQNGNAYVDGLSSFWEPVKAFWENPEKEEHIKFINSMSDLQATKWQYLTGVRDVSSISPDAWIVDQAGLDRPGNLDIQFDLFYSYRTNLPLYPKWQEYFKKFQPPTLIMWGTGDEIFPQSGAMAYRKDLPDAQIHLLNTGHFALEEDGPVIASLILNFLEKNNIK